MSVKKDVVAEEVITVSNTMLCISRSTGSRVVAAIHLAHMNGMREYLYIGVCILPKSQLIDGCPILENIYKLQKFQLIDPFVLVLQNSFKYCFQQRNHCIDLNITKTRHKFYLT